MVLAPLIGCLAIIFLVSILTFLYGWWYEQWRIRDVLPIFWVFLALALACFFAILSLFMITNWAPLSVVPVN